MLEMTSGLRNRFDDKFKPLQEVVDVEQGDVGREPRATRLSSRAEQQRTLFIVAMVAYTINERMALRIDYLLEDSARTRGGLHRSHRYDPVVVP